VVDVVGAIDVVGGEDVVDVVAPSSQLSTFALMGNPYESPSKYKEKED